MGLWPQSLAEPRQLRPFLQPVPALQALREMGVLSLRPYLGFLPCLWSTALLSQLLLWQEYWSQSLGCVGRQGDFCCCFQQSGTACFLLCWAPASRNHRYMITCTCAYIFPSPVTILLLQPNLLLPATSTEWYRPWQYAGNMTLVF